MPSPSIRSNADFFRRLWKFTFVLSSLVAVGFLLYRLSNVVVVVLLSLMLTTTLNPLVKSLQKRFSRHFSITIIITTILLSLVSFLVLTIPPVVNQSDALVRNLPKYSVQVEKSLGRFGPAFQRTTKKWTSPNAVATVEPQTLQNVGQEVLGFLTGLATVLIMTTYLLVDGAQVATTLTKLFPRASRLTLRRLFGEIGEQVGEYLRGQVITSGLAAAFTAVFLVVVGVPEPFALAGLMAVADAVPIVGVFIGTIPAVLMALTKDTSTGVIVLVGYIVYHGIESYVLVPRIYGKMMKMPAVAILLAILVGSSLWGILGALFALPAAAAIPILLRYWEEWRTQQEALENAEGTLSDATPPPSPPSSEPEQMATPRS